LHAQYFGEAKLTSSGAAKSLVGNKITLFSCPISLTVGFYVLFNTADPDLLQDPASPRCCLFQWFLVQKRCKSVKGKTHKPFRGEMVRGMVIFWDITLC